MYFKYLFILLLISNSYIYGQVDITNSTEERILKEGLLLEEGSFYPSDHELFRPELIAYDTLNRRFYIYDYGIGNLVAVQFLVNNYQAGEIIKIGNGIGSGPGEFRNPTSICLSSDNKLTIADPDLARISVWDINDYSMVSSFRPNKFMPFRITCNESVVVLYSLGFNRQGTLAVYNYKGELLSYVEEPNRNRDNVSAMETGFLSIMDNFVYYSGSDTEILKKYSISNKNLVGKDRFVSSNEIENVLESSKTDEEITYKRGDDFRYASRGMGILDNYLVVFYSGRKDAYGNIVDFYSLNDLKYQFSTKIDGLANEMVVNGERLLLNTYDYDRKENFIKIYTLNE